VVVGTVVVDTAVVEVSRVARTAAVTSKMMLAPSLRASPVTVLCYPPATVASVTTARAVRPSAGKVAEAAPVMEWLAAAALAPVDLHTEMEARSTEASSTIATTTVVAAP
jgi:hypothetical protein